MKCNTYYGDHIFYDDMNKAIQTEDITFYNKYLKNNMRALDQTCPIMIQRLNNIFQRNPLISIGI